MYNYYRWNQSTIWVPLWNTNTKPLLKRVVRSQSWHSCPANTLAIIYGLRLTIKNTVCLTQLWFTKFYSTLWQASRSRAIYANSARTSSDFANFAISVLPHGKYSWQQRIRQWMIDTIVIYTKAELKIPIVFSVWEKTAVFGPRGLPFAKYVYKQICEKIWIAANKS